MNNLKISHINITPQNISFESLSANKKLGEAVLREFRDEFQRPKSSSFIKVRLFRLRNHKNFAALKPKCLKLAANLRDQIYILRQKVEISNVYNTLEEFVNKLAREVKSKKIGNCGECADLIQHKLLKAGEKPHNIQIKVITVKDFCENKTLNGNHIFTVFGLKPNANLTKPETWGTQAVIVDAWSGIVKEAHEALEEIKSLLCFDSQKQEMKINSTDIWDAIRFHKLNKAQLEQLRKM